MISKAKPKRKARIGFLIVCVLVLCCYFFRHDLLVFGFDSILRRQVSKHFSHPLTYEAIRFENDKIVALGVNLSDEHFHLTMDRLEFDWNFDLSTLYFETHFHLIHPELTFLCHHDKTSFPLFLGMLIPGKFFGIKADIRNGVLQLGSNECEQRLYFSFVSQKEKEEIGTFYLSYDPHLYALPTTELHLSLNENEINASLNVGQMESERLLRLLSFFYPECREGWENVEGEVALAAEASFSQDFIVSRLSGCIEASNIYFSNPLIDLHAHVKSLHGEWCFPPHEEIVQKAPFWKQVRATTSIEEGEWVFGTTGLRDVNAHLLLDPTIDPFIDLQGILVKGEKEAPITIQGKGSVHEDESFWLEMGIKISSQPEEPSNAFISICSSEKASYVVQLECKQVDAALLEMAGLFPEGLQGKIQAQVTGWIEADHFVKVQIEDFIADKMECKLGKEEILFCTDRIQGEALLAYGPDSWQILNLKGKIQEAFFQKEHFISPSFQIDLFGEGSVISSRLNLNNEEPIAKLEDAKNRPFEPLICDARLPTSSSMSPRASFGRHPERCLPSESDLKIIDFSLSSSCAMGSEYLEIHFDLLKSEGWLHSEQLTEHSYGPWLKTLLPDINLEGDFNLFASFNLQKVLFSLKGNQITVDHPLATFHLQEMKNPALINYNFLEKKWQGAWTIQNGSLIHKQQGYLFDNISASLELDGLLLEAKEITGQCEEIKFACAINADMKEEIYSLTSSKLEGPLTPFSNWFGWKIPITGKFLSKEDGLSLVYKDNGLEFKFRASLSDMTLELKKELSLHTSSAELDFDSKTGQLLLTDIDAQLDFRGKTSRLVGYAKKKEWWEFDLRALDEQREIARAVGIAQERPPSELHFAFEKNKTHFLGAKLSITRLIVKDWTELLALEMTPQFSIDQLKEHIEYLHRLNVISFDELPFPVTCDLQTKISYEDFLTLEAVSPCVFLGNTKYLDCSLFAEKKENLWTMKVMSKEQGTLETILLEEDQGLKIQAFNVYGPHFHAALEGTYNSEQHVFLGKILGWKWDDDAFSAEGEGTISYHSLTKGAESRVSICIKHPFIEAFTTRPVKGGFSQSRGLWMEDLDFQVQKKEVSSAAGKCLIGQILYDGEKWIGKKIQIDASSEFLASFFPKTPFPLQGMMEGEYINKSSLLKLSGKTSLEKNPLYFQIQLDHSQELLGSIKITDDPKKPGIRSLFRSDFQWESFQGEIEGLKLDLSKLEPHILKGSIVVNGAKLSKYFSQDKRDIIEKLRLTSDIECVGNLDLNSHGLKGILQANNFSIMGLHFIKMRSEISFAEEECIFENFSIDDPAGYFLIKHALLTNEGKWNCHIPLISIQDLQPSRLKKGDGFSQKLKPFIIKKLSLYDLEGKLDELSSWTARGRLHFTNAFKKEFNLLEIPLDLLKNLGLDLGLFTPVYGEAEFHLQKGQFIVTALENTYSEGKRSEFYLREGERCYLDLEGNLHLDLRMKQNVLLNITEPFTLTVRGNLEKPKYSLVR